jgi:hypothetical protein
MSKTGIEAVRHCGIYFDDLVLSQASVVRQLKESEMATQWTLLYQLNSKLRILFSSIPSVDNRLLIEYSATSQS